MAIDLPDQNQRTTLSTESFLLSFALFKLLLQRYAVRE